jgi:monoamine oxidase
MRDVAIVEGGRSGLALVTKLLRPGREIVALEAKDPPGDRIPAAPDPNGSGLDFGAIWRRPETQPLIAQLAEELGLAHFAQHGAGAVGESAAAQKEKRSVHAGED